eukprot:8201534-Karenia_brevis.AAC.1
MGQSPKTHHALTIGRSAAELSTRDLCAELALSSSTCPGLDARRTHAGHPPNASLGDLAFDLQNMAAIPKLAWSIGCLSYGRHVLPMSTCAHVAKQPNP